MSVKIRRLSYALGAEISGVDIRKPLDDKSFSEIHKAFLEHDGVLLFRGQPLTAAQHVAFSRFFGEIDDNKHQSPRFRHPECPEVLLGFNPNSNRESKKSDQYQGEHWHTDRSFTQTPPTVSLLRAVIIPEVGGDTMFANMYLAYETLSDEMKKLVEGLDAIHLGGGSASRKEAGLEVPPIAHPVVKVHSETGRKALYICEYPKIVQFVGMTAEESKPLIDFLCRHATRPQFCYRHVWQKDDLLLWDNRCLIHNALGDYDRALVRDMERTTVNGPKCGYVYRGAVEYEGARL